MFFFKIWKTAEPYIQNYLNWYHIQNHGEPLPQPEPLVQKCFH
jgi:hypothetical protein